MERPGDGNPAALHASAQRKGCVFIIHTKAPYVQTESPAAVANLTTFFCDFRGKSIVFFVPQPGTFLGA